MTTTSPQLDSKRRSSARRDLHLERSSSVPTASAALTAPGRALAEPQPLGWPWRSRRFVLATAQVDGHQVDSFQATDPRLFQTIFRSVARYLPARGALRLDGVEECWLLFGLRVVRTQASLGSADAAVEFLAPDS